MMIRSLLIELAYEALFVAYKSAPDLDVAIAFLSAVKYSDEQPRDERGQFASGGGSNNDKQPVEFNIDKIAKQYEGALNRLAYDKRNLGVADFPEEDRKKINGVVSLRKSGTTIYFNLHRHTDPDWKGTPLGRLMRRGGNWVADVQDQEKFNIVMRLIRDNYDPVYGTRIKK